MNCICDLKLPLSKDKIIAKIPRSFPPKRPRWSPVSTTPFPQKMKKGNFEKRLNNLLSFTEFKDIIYEKKILDIHHIIVVNWKIFEYEILGNQRLWGRSRCFSTFNREIIVQGYQKVKFQSSEISQKVLLYLLATGPDSDSLKSHVPCFIPAAEIRKKQKALDTNPKFYNIIRPKLVKSIQCGKCEYSNFILFTKTHTHISTSTAECSRNSETVQTAQNEYMRSKSYQLAASATLTSEFSMNQTISRSAQKRTFDQMSQDEIHSTMYLDRLKYIAIKNVAEDIINQHIKSLLDMILNDDCTENQVEDVLIWEPTKLSEKEVVRFLKDSSQLGAVEEHKQSAYSLVTMNTRQPDNENALLHLANAGYNAEDALQAQKLGKYKIFTDDNRQKALESKPHDTTDSDSSELSCSTQTDSESDTTSDDEHVQELSNPPWTDKMKLNFEKGLIHFGENVDKIHKHFLCFNHLKPHDLDLYFYSDERQKFIGNPEISKKIVGILDQTSLKHLQKIEFFELGRDWAKMRQNAQSSTSESDDSTGMEIRQFNKFGRIIKTFQRKKRPRRLPNRFLSFQM